MIRKIIVFSGLVLLPLFMMGQSDSLTQKKRYLSFGTPLMPGMHYGVSGIYDAQLKTFFHPSHVLPTSFSVLYTGSTKRSEYYSRMGITYSKLPNKYGTIHFSTNIGIEGVLYESLNLMVGINANCMLGYLEYYYTYIYTSSRNIKTMQRDVYTRYMSREFLFGSSWGMHFNYFIHRKLFIKTEIQLMGYLSKGKAVVLNNNYPEIQSISNSGLLFSQLLGFYIGYKF
jgi:hypothetical protein